MLTNGIARPSREAGLQEIEKLVSSHLLHNSESLCNLLRFLAAKSLDSPGVPVKEYEIATDVFHRSPSSTPGWIPPSGFRRDGSDRNSRSITRRHLRTR